jgi:beta-lactamase class A
MAMVQESEAAQLSWFAYRFSATNFEKIVNKNSAYLAEKNLTNKYPIGIGPWKNSAGDVGYITVWEENVDNLDWQIVHTTPAAWSFGDEEGVFWDNWNQGYRIRSFAKYCKPIVTNEPISCVNKFLAVWINDKDSFFGEVSYKVSGAAAFKEKLLLYKEKNYELVDVDQYIQDGDEKFAGQWVRRFRKNFLGSNLTGSGDKFDQLNSLLSGYDGNVGFYIEDLSTGNNIYYNRHEHFYMASVSKVWIAAKILSMVDAGTLSLDDEYIFFNEDYLEEVNTPGILDISKIGQSFTLEEYIGWMLNYSSTNATDKLFGLIGNEGMNDYLTNALGIRSIGEVTSICDLDKRVASQAVSCASSLPCNVFERWFREDENIATGSSQESCLDSLESDWATLNADQKTEHYRTYYDTLANSISPAQMAQFYRRLLSFELLQPETRNKLIEIMVATGSGANNDNITGLGLYNKLACKGGNQWRSQSWTAVTWFEGDTESLSDATFNYNINVFIEQFPGGTDADYDEAKNLSRDVIGLAVGFLSENN